MSGKKNAFLQHIIDAIKINKKRRPVYAKMSGGKSLFISNMLILSEMMTLPVAFLFDKWALKFNRNGIKIVLNDFADMHNLPPPHQEPRFRNKSTKKDFIIFRQMVSQYRKQISKLISNGKLSNTTSIIDNLLKEITNNEKVLHVHFSMTKHIIESMLLIAGNGLKYAKQSDGKTQTLTSWLLRVHLLTLFIAPRFDFKAQTLHNNNIGILVNDLPVIIE